MVLGSNPGGSTFLINFGVLAAKRSPLAPNRPRLRPRRPAFSKPAVIQLMQAFFDKHLKGAAVEIQLVPESELAAQPTKPLVK